MENQETEEKPIYAVIYAAGTGKISHTMYGQESAIAHFCSREGLSYLIVESEVSGGLSYVRNGVLSPRPEMAVGLDDSVLRGGPVGAEIEIDGTAVYTATDPEILIDSSDWDTIRVLFWPFQDKVFKNANNQI